MKGSGSVQRLLCLAVSAGIVLLFRRGGATPADAEARLVLFVLSLGYGHLIGAAVAGRRRASAWIPDRAPRVLVALFTLASVVCAFVAYQIALARAPEVVWGLLAVATWHTVENDLAMHAPAAGSLGLPPVSRSLAEHARALGITAVLLVGFQAALSTEGGAVPPLAPVGGSAPALPNAGFTDLFATVTLYHLLAWLGWALRRVRGAPLPVRRSTGRLLAVVHAPALAAGLCVAAGPSELALGLRRVLFSPDLYLFWSSLHVVQTLAIRRLAPPRRSPGAARCPDP